MPPSVGVPTAEEGVGSPARGREPLTQTDRVTHVGRGGAGNIRSQSRVPVDPCEFLYTSLLFPPFSFLPYLGLCDAAINGWHTPTL